MLRTRILTAAVLIPLVLVALFGLGARGWALVTLGMVAVATYEWGGLAGYRRPASLAFAVGTLVAGAFLVLAPGGGFTEARGWPEALVPWVCGVATLFWAFVAPAWLYFGWRIESRSGLALIGWVLLIATWVAVVQVRIRSPGLLVSLMAIVWVADTAAYFAGRRFGRHKLAPLISPGKTWEGVWGALLAVAVYALALLPLATRLEDAPAITAGTAAGWVALALALAVLSIVGDLFESRLKRQRGVKDSGSILPGHGGVLDRIDALIAAMPGAALVEHYLVR